MFVLCFAATSTVFIDFAFLEIALFIFFVIDRKFICNYSDNGFIVLVISEAKMPTVCYLQLHKRKNLMFSFCTYDSKLSICGFWTVGQIIQDILIHHLGLTITSTISDNEP